MKRIRHFICLLLIVALCLQAIPVAAKSSTNVTEKNKEDTLTTKGELHGFYPSYLTFSEDIKKYIDNLDSISFAFSKIDGKEATYWNTVKAKNGNYDFYYPTDYMLPIEYAKSQGKPIQLNVYMNGSDGITLLPDKNARKVIIKEIIKSMKTDLLEGKQIYYDGVVIDFEGLRDTNSNKEPILYKGKPISTYYTQFLKELKKQLDPLGKKLYAAVNPALYYDGYNYTEILDIADRVILMAHDYDPSENLKKSHIKQYTGYDSLNPVHSLSPIQMVRRALNDLQEAAADKNQLSKVWLQLNFDAAQWQFDVKDADGWMELSDNTLSRGRRISPLYKTIKARVDNTDGYAKNMTYGYNNELQSPFIQYYNSFDKSWNVIIYEDSTSLLAKIELAKSYNLGGISLWSLYNIPDYKDKVGKKFHLNGWSTIITAMKSYKSASPGSKEYITFKDPVIEQAVREKLGKASGKISVLELKSIYRIKLPEGVKSLKDLKNLSNLEYLDANKLNVSDISAIGSLKNLKVLYLTHNKLSDVKALKNFNKIELLFLNGTKIIPK